MANYKDEERFAFGDDEEVVAPKKNKSDGNYYYVEVANITHNPGYKYGSIYSQSLGYYEPSALAIIDFKKRKNFFLIGEIIGDKIVDVVTGRSYARKDGNTYSGDEGYSQDLILRTVKSMPLSNAAEQLKIINRFNIKKYEKALDELESYIYWDYQDHVKSVAAYNRQQQEDDAYIKNFKKRFGR